MNDWRQHKVHNDERAEETPPFSRIFIVCDKKLTEDELKEPFLKYGHIDYIHMPRDRQTGESKGVAYIKYSKTSSAAAAIQDLHLSTSVGNTNKPIKVMVANNPNENDKNANSESKYKRLFIMVSKTDTETSVRDHFATFGKIQSLYFQKNRGKFAYVTYQSFLDAAKAFEECDQRFKAVFAVPKEELKRSRDTVEFNVGRMSSSPVNHKDKYPNNHDPFYKCNITDLQAEDYIWVSATVSPPLPEQCLYKLFNIIPGLNDFQYSEDSYNGVAKVLISYDRHISAALAVEKINNFIFPSGEVIIVKPNTSPIAKVASDLSIMVNNLKNAVETGSSSNNLAQLADAIAHASSLLKVASAPGTHSNEYNFSSIKLPSIKPPADHKSPVAKRCFIVCKPQPPPVAALRDVFCRFGNLIDVMTYPNKTYGFVRYASTESADEAIRTINGATIYGALIKCVEADERQSTDDSVVDSKRKKIDDH